MQNQIIGCPKVGEGIAVPNRSCLTVIGPDEGIAVFERGDCRISLGKEEYFTFNNISSLIRLD